MKKVLVALMAAACLLLGGLFYWMQQQDDAAAPVISFPDTEVIYEEGQDTEFLLEGVTAVDDVDGDVSDTLVVESVIPMQDQTQATVLYFAKDRSNNVAKEKRIVTYYPADAIEWVTESETDTEPETEEATEEETESLPAGSPRITLTTDAVTVKSGEDYNLLDYVKEITDDEDGPDWLYGQIHIDGMYDIAGSGVYELYYTVVDRQGNMSNRAKLTLTIE